MSADKLDEAAQRAARAEYGHNEYDREHNFRAMNSAIRKTRVRAIRAALDEAVDSERLRWCQAFGLCPADADPEKDADRIFRLHVEAVAERDKEWKAGTVAAVALAVAEERRALREYWSDIEARSADAHAAYQAEAHRRGDVRHADAYADLPEATKEWDRVLIRWILAALAAREATP